MCIFCFLRTNLKTKKTPSSKPSNKLTKLTKNTHHNCFSRHKRKREALKKWLYLVASLLYLNILYCFYEGTTINVTYEVKSKITLSKRLQDAWCMMHDTRGKKKKKHRTSANVPFFFFILLCSSVSILHTGQQLFIHLFWIKNWVVLSGSGKLLFQTVY